MATRCHLISPRTPTSGILAVLTLPHARSAYCIVKGVTPSGGLGWLQVLPCPSLRREETHQAIESIAQETTEETNDDFRARACAVKRRGRVPISVGPPPIRSGVGCQQANSPPGHGKGQFYGEAVFFIRGRDIGTPDSPTVDDG